MLILPLLSGVLAAQEPQGFPAEFSGEFNLTAKHLVQLANAIPADKYGWRPAPGVRSVSEVFVHIANGNFLILDFAGVPAPEDLFGKAGGPAKDRIPALLKRNGEQEKTITDKQQVVALLERSIATVRDTFAKADLDKSVMFFGHSTTVRGLYLRILAHVNEHFGQSVAYARVNGVVPPWSQPAPKKD